MHYTVNNLSFYATVKKRNRHIVVVVVGGDLGLLSHTPGPNRPHWTEPRLCTTVQAESNETGPDPDHQSLSWFGFPPVLYWEFFCSLAQSV